MRNVGFNLTWRWQSEFLWQSPLADGIVPAYNTIDAPLNVRLPRSKTTVKAWWDPAC